MIKRTLLAILLSTSCAQAQTNLTPPSIPSGTSIPSPVFSGTITGTVTWAGTPTLNAPLAFGASGSLTAPKMTGAGTNSGNTNFNGGFTWAGTALTQPLLALISSNGVTPVNVIGTTGNTGGPIGLALHASMNASLDASANTGGTAGGVISTQYATSSRGGLAGFVNNMAIPTNITIGDGSVKEFVGGRDTATAASPSGAQAHSVIGRTTVAQLTDASATGYGALIGQEIAMQAIAGTSVVQKYNQYLMRYAADAARGSSNDAEIGMWNQYTQGSGVGAKVGLDVGPGGQTGLFFPIAADGTIIKASAGATDGALTVASILDFSAIGTVTGNSIAVPNFTVTGAGKVLAGSHILATSAAPSISSCGTGSPTVSGGDNFGTVVAGTVATTCIINFGTTWGTAPRCMASSGTAIASLTVNASTTQLTIGGTALGGDTINWICGSTARLMLPANDNALTNERLVA